MRLCYAATLLEKKKKQQMVGAAGGGGALTLSRGTVKAHDEEGTAACAPLMYTPTILDFGVLVQGLLAS